MLRWKRDAVDLVCEEGIARHHLLERKAPLVRLLLATLDATVEQCAGFCIR